ncbi:MAG: hypothetical protein AAF573_18880 [Bacteroidota bacterium]
MKGYIRFLKVDIAIQTILLICVVPCLVLYFLIGFPLISLGAWQILSALVAWFTIKSKAHKKYLIRSISYVSVGLLLIYNNDYLSYELGLFLVVVGLIIIPIGIAIWYYDLTKKTLKTLKENRVIEYEYGAFDNVLDSDEILHNNINTKL